MEKESSRNHAYESLNSAKWIRHFDDEQQSFYLYNAETGESVWATEGETFGTRNDSDNDGQMIDQTNKDDSYLIENRIEKENMTLTTSNYDINCYWRCVYINAILVEQPLGFCEACFRSACFLCITLIAIAFAGRVSSSAKEFALEGVISLAAASSLIIPGIIVFAYWDYKGEADWTVQPVPTLLGWVDVRRFAAITFGGAIDADNVISCEGNQDWLSCSQAYVTRSIPCMPKLIYVKLMNVARGIENL